MYSFIRSFLFSLEAEKSHHVAMKTLKILYPAWLANMMVHQFPKNSTEVFGIKFPNPVGLAAGFAKEGDYLDQLLGLGFGFVELGTVTPRPQPGNPKPRIFRIPQAQALINRMGFPSLGVDHFIDCMKNRKVPGIVGINLGMNKSTPLENAVDDYREVMAKVYPYADFLTINISSPNTPGLRELQGEKYLHNLLKEVKIERDDLAEYYNREVPLLIKISIDLNEYELSYILEAVLHYKIDGIITSNTSIDHHSVASFPHGNELGGLSGKPIFEKSTEMIHKIHQQTKGELPIIAVGGIASAEDAQKKIDAGASLVQIYTGFIYKGPGLIREIVRKLKV